MVKKAIIILALIVAAVGGWLIVGRLFPSDKKRVEWTLGDIRKAVEGGDAQRCMAFVSPDYFYDNMNRKALAVFAEGVLKLSGPMNVRVLRQDVTVLAGGGFAVTAGEVLSTPRAGSDLPGPVRTSWNLTFRKEGKDWKVWQVELNSVNGERVQGLRGLLELAR